MTLNWCLASILEAFAVNIIIVVVKSCCCFCCHGYYYYYLFYFCIYSTLLTKMKFNAATFYSRHS